jgi:hypothetical protein
MTAVALSPPAPLPLPRRSAAHRLALGLVWLTVVAGSVVASEPAPVDVLTMGLVLLLPLIGLVAVSRALVGLLALMLVVAAGGYLAAGMAVEIGQAVTHTSVSLYLYVAAFVLAAFVAKRPEAHARLMLNAYLWAAAVAALAGIAGYFDVFPGAHELLTRYDRATGFFKDPNVFGPFLVPALVYAASRFAALPLRKALAPLGVLLLVGLAMLLSFSRGAWFNLVVALAVYGMLYLLTLRSHRARLRFAGLAVAGLVALAALVAAALQFDAVATLYEERAALTQSYDEGPEAPSSSFPTITTRSRTTSMRPCSSTPAGSAGSSSSPSLPRPRGGDCATPSCAASRSRCSWSPTRASSATRSRVSSSTSTIGATSTCCWRWPGA